MMSTSTSTSTSTETSDLKTRIASYEAGAAVLRRAVDGLTDQQINQRMAPGTWSIKEIVVHMVDSDLAATHRMRRIAAESMPLLVSYDENAFIAHLASDQVAIADALDLFSANRAFTARWLRTLAPAAFERAGIHTQRGKVTLREMLAMYTEHVAHHMKFVDGKRASLGV